MTLFDAATYLCTKETPQFVSTKPLPYYQIYDDFLSSHSIRVSSILEIGVSTGFSTKVFSLAFPDAKILAIDRDQLSVDFKGFQNVFYHQCDQTDTDRLGALINEFLPDGIDMVVDDASHVGYFTAVSFNCVFPRVNHGGAVFIEDWATGYWDTFIDGGRYQEFPVVPSLGYIPTRFPSHDFGLVGFVKTLVDWTSEPEIRVREQDPPVRQSRLKLLEFRQGICSCIKA